jgi:hypothetical protein
MSINVTSIPIVNGGNFIYSPAMQIGSSNNKPLKFLVNGFPVIDLDGTAINLLEPLGVEASGNTPTLEAPVIPTNSYGNTNSLNEHTWFEILISGDVYLVPCYPKA